MDEYLKRSDVMKMLIECDTFTDVYERVMAADTVMVEHCGQCQMYMEIPVNAAEGVMIGWCRKRALAVLESSYCTEGTDKEAAGS